MSFKSPKNAINTITKNWTNGPTNEPRHGRVFFNDWCYPTFTQDYKSHTCTSNTAANIKTSILLLLLMILFVNRKYPIYDHDNKRLWNECRLYAVELHGRCCRHRGPRAMARVVGNKQQLQG